ncbi:MAG: signal peptidase I [Saccharospirillum sp.]
MPVIYLFWLCLVIFLLLSVLIFRRHHRLLLASANEPDWSAEKLQQQFAPSAVEKMVGYALLAALVLLVWQTIRQSFDFALLLVVATLATGLVYAADAYWLRPKRRALLETAAEQVSDLDIKQAELDVEPGLIENSRAFFPVLLVVFVLRSFLFEPFQIPSGSMKPTLEIGDFILVNRFTYGIRMPVTNQVVVPIGTPERGDVIVFRPPHEPDKNFIKRVIGLPGDRIQYDYIRRELRINGERVTSRLIESAADDEGRYRLLEEALGDMTHAIYYNERGPARTPHEWLPAEGVTVPEGQYFVMGDNRDASHDSRYWEGQRRMEQRDFNNEGNNAWGFVDENAILGEAIAIWMQWKGWYPSFSRFGAIE